MALTPRDKDFSARYNELVVQADLAQNSSVRGCMVIKPYGYAVRENMQKILDFMFKATGHVNAYFPLLIPKSYFTKEAKHVEGFATEAAVVTHYRLKKDEVTNQIIVDPEAKLEEELIIRPTSETIIWNTYKDWIKSYRDLPLLINQWANVMRWEMRTRLFLRTSEFLWQEWHTAHATAQEALEETKRMRKVYQEFFEKVLAMSGVWGEKSENERFAWAENTFTIECMMQDGKALQACTSHFLGQNFGKAFDVTFANKNNEQEHAWATSRWASTRMIGGLIMSHSDDKGLVLPPMIAPIHVVFIPVWKTEEERQSVSDYITSITGQLDQQELEVQFDIEKKQLAYKLPISYKIDRDDQKTMWWKQNQYELQWVPLRIAIGPKDIAANNIQIAIRDTHGKMEYSIGEHLWSSIKELLTVMQERLYDSTRNMRETNTIKVNTRDEFTTWLEDGKFVLAHRDGTIETEEKIKESTKATIRCLPYDNLEHDLYTEQGACILTGKPSSKRVLFAIAY